MSGGSYNYLCFKTPDQLWEAIAENDITSMSERLSALGIHDASVETAAVQLLVEQFENNMLRKLSRLAGIWRAVEWHDSGDWGKGHIDEAVAKYRTRRGDDNPIGCSNCGAIPDLKTGCICRGKGEEG